MRREHGDIPHQPPPLSDVLLVTASDGYDHLVSDRIFATSHDGRFLARCGATVLSKSMCNEPQALCPLCVPPLPVSSYVASVQKRSLWASIRAALLPWEMARAL